jgi:hypothetical protein
MHRNGFIFIALISAVAAVAGPRGYLPKVGPVALRLPRPAAPAVAAEAPPPPVAELPAPAPLPGTEPPPTVALSESPPEPPANPPSSLMQNPPVVLLAVASQPPTNVVTEPLVGSAVETNAMITPQMFLRFFGPAAAHPGGGAAYEAVIVPPPNFIPAQPAVALPSSTVSYTQPKP